MILNRIVGHANRRTNETRAGICSLYFLCVLSVREVLRLPLDGLLDRELLLESRPSSSSTPELRTLYGHNNWSYCFRFDQRSAARSILSLEMTRATN